MSLQHTGVFGIQMKSFSFEWGVQRPVGLSPCVVGRQRRVAEKRILISEYVIYVIRMGGMRSFNKTTRKIELPEGFNTIKAQAKARGKQALGIQLAEWLQAKASSKYYSTFRVGTFQGQSATSSNIHERREKVLHTQF